MRRRDAAATAAVMIAATGAILLMTWATMSATDKFDATTLAPEGPAWLWKVGLPLALVGSAVTWALVSGNPSVRFPWESWPDRTACLVPLGMAVWAGVIAYVRRQYEYQSLRALGLAAMGIVFAVFTWFKDGRPFDLD